MIRPTVQISLLLVLILSLAGCVGCRKSGGTDEDVFGTLIPPPRDKDDTSTSDAGTGQTSDIGRPPTPPGQGQPVPIPLSLMKTVYFDYDRSDIRADQRKAMEDNAQYLLKNADRKILIEGHCDERGTLEYNMALGMRRANQVVQFFISRGVSKDQIETSSKGEEAPAVQGSGSAVWAKNRRAEFYFTN